MNKLLTIKSGNAVIVGDFWLDENEKRLPNDFVTIPNPNQTGILDKYVGGLSSCPVIANYRKRQYQL